MASNVWNDLAYGHFGNACYDPEEGTWSFVRSPGQETALQPLGELQTFVPAATGAAAHAPSRQHEIPSKRHERQIKEVTRRFPKLQPAGTLLRPLLQASEAVEEATARHDLVKGQRLTFGRIFDESLRRSAQVAAFSSGPSGSDLRIVQAQLQKQGWEDSRDVWVEVPVFAGEEATWHGGGSPIQQVCFAKPVENGECLLAVRMITRIVIFKPVLRKSGSGRLHANELCEVHMSETGNVPHADVAFNPWFTRQFALIDQVGNWSVWEFGNREARSAKCVHRFSGPEEAEVSSSSLNDGWARISWCFDPNHVLIATRRKVSLFDIASGLEGVQEIDVGLSASAGWILDVAILAGHTDKVCALMTTHLHILLLKERDGVVKARADMQIRHHRSPEDITLSITTFESGEGRLARCDVLGLRLILYRRSSPAEIRFERCASGVSAELR